MNMNAKVTGGFKMNNKFYDNAGQFKIDDDIHDFDAAFHYYLEIGKTEKNIPIKVEMSGYIDESKENFPIVVFCDDCMDDTTNINTDNIAIKGYFEEENKIVWVDIPDKIQAMIISTIKTEVIKNEAEKILASADFYADRTVDVYKNEDTYTFEGIGSFQDYKIHADMHCEIRKDEGYHVDPSYNMDGDKAYITVPQNDDFPDGKMYFDLPHDVLEKLEQKCTKLAVKFKCSELRQKLYDEYTENFNNGLEDGDEQLCFKDWLETAYPDESYFKSHVAPAEAKFLCAYDKFINLNYINLYEDSLKSCYSLKGEDLSEEKTNYYELIDVGLIHEDMDILLSRSDNPDIVKELCEEYDIEADSYVKFFFEMGDLCTYVAFEVDDSIEDPPIVTASVTMSLPNETIDLTQIPLSDSESAFVLRAVAQYKEQQVEAIQNKLYETYKEEWLKENVSEADWDAVEAEWDDLENQDVYDSFEEFCEEVGFGNGCCYVCLGEFLDYEYQDVGWITNHLTAEEAVFLAKNDENFPLGIEEMQGTNWKDGKSVSVIGGEMTVDKKDEPKEKDERGR